MQASIKKIWKKHKLQKIKKYLYKLILREIEILIFIKMNIESESPLHTCYVVFFF